MSSRQRRAVPTSNAAARDRLLDATAQLLRTSRPEQVTSRAIADTAGENLAAITYYFGSKDHLVTEAMTATARSLIEPAIVELANDNDPIQKLLATTQMLYRILEQNRHQLPGYMRTLAAVPADAALGDQIRSLHRSLTDVLSEQIARQQHHDLLPAWIAPKAMAQLIIAVVHGVIVSSTTNPIDTDETAIGSQFAQLLLTARTPHSHDVLSATP